MIYACVSVPSIFDDLFECPCCGWLYWPSSEDRLHGWCCPLCSHEHIGDSRDETLAKGVGGICFAVGTIDTSSRSLKTLSIAAKP
jgi:hypothetical protein